MAVLGGKMISKNEIVDEFDELEWYHQQYEKVLEDIAILRNNLEEDARRYPELAQAKLAEAVGLHRAFEIVRDELRLGDK